MLNLDVTIFPKFKLNLLRSIYVLNKIFSQLRDNSTYFHIFHDALVVLFNISDALSYLHFFQYQIVILVVYYSHFLIISCLF